jgi:hypothetical protein
LYIYVRNVEDGTQIIEHILSYFTPDYTIKLNLIPEMGIIKEVPIILNSSTSEIEYEGDKNSQTRMIIWTLNFTVKGFIFGKISETGLIQASITNILNQISSTDTVVFNMAETGSGTYQAGELVYQGYSPTQSVATGKVVFWKNNILHLTNINGNFVSSLPVWGYISNANYNFTGYNVTSQQPVNLAQIVVVTDPTDANSNTNYSYTTTITEIPNIDENVILSDGFNTDMNSNVFGKDDLTIQQENPIDLGS